MPDSQSSEPLFESLFATVWTIGHFRSLHWRPSWLSCINEYLAIDSGGNVSDLVFAGNCCMARMLPGEAELVSEWTGLPGTAKSVKRFERSNGLDTVLYKNYLYLFFTYWSSRSLISNGSNHYQHIRAQHSGEYWHPWLNFRSGAEFLLFLAGSKQPLLLVLLSVLLTW